MIGHAMIRVSVGYDGSSPRWVRTSTHRSYLSVELCLKWAAYRDRGNDDPHTIHDMLDIIAVLASRHTITADVEHADTRVRSFIRENCSRLVTSDSLEDILAAHLNNSQDPHRVVQWVRARLMELAQL